MYFHILLQMKEKEVLNMTHSCPLSPSSWPKHHVHIIFSGCSKGTENADSLQLLGKGDDSPPQESAIAFSGGEGEGCSGEALCQ